MITLKLTPDQAAKLKSLLAEQAEAADILQALEVAMGEPLYCEVCREPFYASKSGSQALYCSARCRQKAYRQREFERKRYFGPDDIWAEED